MHNNLGRFDLNGIPTTPRGVSRIELSFQIDANGILKVGVVKPRYRDPPDVKRKLKKDLSSNARALRRLRTTRARAKGAYASTAPPLATATRCSRSFIERAPTSTSKHDPTVVL
ncbi:hypothetical protein FRC00_002632, partial [Tulasnella sp. 408]